MTRDLRTLIYLLNLELREECSRTLGFFVFFSMKVYAKEAQGIQNSIKLMLLHPGVSKAMIHKHKRISMVTTLILMYSYGSLVPRPLPQLSLGGGLGTRLLLWYSYMIKLSKWSK